MTVINHNGVRLAAGLGATLLMILGQLVTEESHAASRSAPPPQTPDFSSTEVHSLHVRGNVHMLVGAGGNVTVHVGEEGVLVVDTQFAPMADKLIVEIRRLAGDKPIRWIVNTHGHPDHIGGNANFRTAGRIVFSGNFAVSDPRGDAGATVFAHENVLLQMVKAEGKPQAVPEANWPTETYIGEGYQFSFNDEPIELIHQPNAHTDGDTMVYFRRSDVLVTGDLYQTLSYPFIDRAQGGTFTGILAALNRMIDITVPRKNQEGGTMVIPGHGRLSDEADVVEYRDMLTAIKTRIGDMVSKGMSLEQVRAARPTQDYDLRYDARLPSWTTDMFIEAVYDDLKTAADNAGGTKS